MSLRKITEEDRKRILERDKDTAIACLHAYFEALEELSSYIHKRLDEIQGAFRDEIIMTSTGIVLGIYADRWPEEDKMLAAASIGVSCKKTLEELDKIVNRDEEYEDD